MHCEFLLECRAANKEFINRLYEATRRKCLVLWQNNFLILYHDNTLAHTSLLTALTPVPVYCLKINHIYERTEIYHDYGDNDRNKKQTSEVLKDLKKAMSRVYFV